MATTSHLSLLLAYFAASPSSSTDPPPLRHLLLHHQPSLSSSCSPTSIATETPPRPLLFPLQSLDCHRDPNPPHPPPAPQPRLPRRSKRSPSSSRFPASTATVTLTLPSSSCSPSTTATAAQPSPSSCFPSSTATTTPTLSSSHSPASTAIADLPFFLEPTIISSPPPSLDLISSLIDHHHLPDLNLFVLCAACFYLLDSALFHSPRLLLLIYIRQCRPHHNTSPSDVVT